MKSREDLSVQRMYSLRGREEFQQRALEGRMDGKGREKHGLVWHEILAAL